MRRVLLPILLTVSALGAAAAFVVTRPGPMKKPVENPGELVEVRTMESGSHRLRVTAQGTLTAAKTLVVQPEVGGRVTWQHENLVPGGRIGKGEPLLRIDARDYKLAAEQLEANVERAELQVRLERIQRDVAKDEWRIIGEDQNATEEGRSLALHEPQLQAAEASLAAARSARSQAQLSVGKTSLSAPFNAWVQSEFVEVGQLVGPQSQIATLIGTDAYWVQVSVPAEQLRALSLPGRREGAVSKALVKQTIGGKTVSREGELLRLLGDLDPVGRLVRLLVEVDDPLNLATPEANANHDEMPLLLGAYVTVEFEGQSLDGVVEVPRAALREGDKVFVYGPNDTLVIRPVEVSWRMPDSVLVSKGLTTGDELITTRIATPIDGMKLRKKVAQASGASPKTDEASPSSAESSTPQ